MKRVRLFPVMTLLVALLLANCASEDPFTIVLIPSDDAVSTEEGFAPTVEYLEAAMGMDVRIVTVADYAAVVEAMKYGHADVARFGPFSYVLATQEANVEALVADVKANTGRAAYNGLILSRPDLETLDGATFAYVDPGSTSGYLVPSTYIKREGIELGEVLFAGSHPAVIQAIRNGSVDAGAVADNRWYYALEEGIVTEDEVKVFWTSPELPVGPWAVRSDLDTQTKEAFKQAMLAMPEAIARAQGVEAIGYVPITDADYHFVRQVQEASE